MPPAPLLIDEHAAGRFLQLLGKQPETTRLRAFPHRLNTRKLAIGPRKGAYSLTDALQWQREGRGVYVVINDGGDKKAEITRCIAFFVEWDDRPIDWQINAWKALGLGEPSVIVSSGGKSIHCYWILKDPIPPEQWEPIQASLITYAGGDQACKDASRVMRLPGCWYIDSTGAPSAQVEILHESGNRYTPEQIEAWIIPDEFDDEFAEEPDDNPFAGLALDHSSASDYPPHTLNDVREALNAIPRRSQPQTYPVYRNILWGLIRACEEAGADRQTAINLMETHSPSNTCGWDIAQVASSGGEHVNAETFWYHARQAGWRPARQQRSTNATGSRSKQSPPNPDRFTPPADTRVRWGHVRLSLNRRLDCFDRCLIALTSTPGPNKPGERNTIRRWAKVRHVLDTLELKNTVRLQDVGQAILEKQDERSGNTFHPLTAADREAMPLPTVEWEIPNCIPKGDLTIIGGRAKVGKTRLANALVRSLLHLEDFLGFGAPDSSRKVILVTDDQGDGDTAQMLQELSIWHHPNLIWSRRFRVTEKNIDALLRAIEDHPGAVVVLDSLRSITRSAAFGENDPEMGSLIYDLKQAVIDAGGTLLLIHHCNKANDTTGTEALSGHNAIAGAGNTILTLHYLAKGNKLVKDSPQRRMVREARSGPPADLVISMLAAGGTFYRVGDYEAFQEEQESENDMERAAKRARKGTPKQQEALRFLQSLRHTDTESPGLLDLCQAIDLVPFGARMKKDLEGDDLTAYKAMGRFLNDLQTIVSATRTGTAGGGYFLRYALTDEGSEWVAEEYGL
jgi:hypothetical protein